MGCCWHISLASCRCQTFSTLTAWCCHIFNPFTTHSVKSWAHSYGSWALVFKVAFVIFCSISESTSLFFRFFMCAGMENLINITSQPNEFMSSFSAESVDVMQKPERQIRLSTVKMKSRTHRQHSSSSPHCFFCWVNSIIVASSWFDSLTRWINFTLLVMWCLHCRHRTAATTTSRRASAFGLTCAHGVQASSTLQSGIGKCLNTMSNMFRSLKKVFDVFEPSSERLKKKLNQLRQSESNKWSVWESKKLSKDKSEKL